MSTVIIPHLDLVINMIEKNIFRPLPILKKAGLPGEGVGMEEVTYCIKLVITSRGPRLASPPARVLILPPTDCQRRRRRQGFKGAYHPKFYPRVFRAF